MWSLRARLMLAVFTLTLVAITGSDFAAHRALKNFLISQLDDQLVTISDSSMMRLDRAGIDLIARPPHQVERLGGDPDLEEPRLLRRAMGMGRNGRELVAGVERLDDFARSLRYALEKGVFISISPDAHQIDGIDDIQYGVAVAQKAMVTKENNLSSFSLLQFENYLAQIRKIKINL